MVIMGKYVLNEYGYVMGVNIYGRENRIFYKDMFCTSEVQTKYEIYRSIHVQYFIFSNGLKERKHCFYKES